MLSETIIGELRRFFEQHPVAQGKATSPAELAVIETSLNKELDEDFKQFSATFGGCVIKDASFYGMHNSELLGDETIIDVHNEFSHYLDREVHLVFGVDGAGNPVYLTNAKCVMRYDHDTEEKHLLAPSFEEYLAAVLRH